MSTSNLADEDVVDDDTFDEAEILTEESKSPEPEGYRSRNVRTKQPTNLSSMIGGKNNRTINSM